MVNQELESPQYDERFGIRQFKATDQRDILKGVVEIIKNGVDAYLREKSEENCNREKIDVIINSTKKSIKIINYAKGMDYQTFNKALKIGADTSGEIGSGAHGYGMKEAAWAFHKTKIISVKDGKYTSRDFLWDENNLPKYGWSVNENNQDIIELENQTKLYHQTQIQQNGTYFEGYFPDNIGFPQLDTIYSRLCDHILLRSINQSELFEIRLFDENKRNQPFRQIGYDMPPIKVIRSDERETIKEGEFKFNYPNYGDINVRYKIYLSSQKLQTMGDTKTAGLLICAEKYSVLDCTLFDHSGDVASKFFGQVDLQGENLRDILKTDMIVEFKRDEGLKKNSKIYEELYKKFNPMLSELVEEERRRQNKKRRDSRSDLISNKLDLIKEFNKIDKEENTDEVTNIKGDNKFFVGEDGMRFTLNNNYLSLIEKQEKSIHLVVDTDIVPPESEIEITSNKKGLFAEPLKFYINKKEIKNGVFKKKITFRGDSIDFYEIKATNNSSLKETKANVEVLKDKRLHINKAIFFFPDEQEIVSGKNKKIPLYINKRNIERGDIELEYDESIFQINKKNLHLGNIEELYGDIYQLDIPIFPKGKPGKSGKIKVRINDCETILNLKIINSKEKHMRGDFEGIEDDDEINVNDIESVAYYENKKICIYVNHPLLKHYANTFGGEESVEYRIMYADAIVHVFCDVEARKKVRKILGENVNSESYRVEYAKHFNQLYKKHAKKLHTFCVNPEMIKKLKVN